MSSMERRDAVIVGGGPAGSTLARALVQAGASVAVFDKQAFPRDKTCAGWITPAPKFWITPPSLNSCDPGKLDKASTWRIGKFRASIVLT